ncbi:MAG: gfo/Idh/MocA family oxidoreductase [Caulobacteraceae bacterium]|nr:gfo/Idh/MocA family oxidoreductase [Caulobacteraceae bacterium]
MKKIGLIGFGYWGKIIYKNLKELGYSITITDKFSIDKSLIKNDDKIVDSYMEIKDVDKVFVVTPCESHEKIVSYFLNKKIDVFCEKPLTLNFDQSKNLFNIARKNNAKLFVDWIFIFNDAINYIKHLLEANTHGKLLNISMRRLNKGPIRNDVNARYDLTSHDLSILIYLIDIEIKRNFFYDYRKLSTSFKEDSCIGVLEFKNNITCTIESSWEHPIKDRQCIFEFENGILIWDDISQTIKVNNIEINFPKTESPLKKSLKTFINSTFDTNQIKRITLEVAKILEKKYEN